MAPVSSAADYAAYLALRVVIAVLQALPLTVCDRGATALAWLMGRWVRMRGALLERNLGIAFPEWDQERREEAIIQMWRHLFLMVTEIAHTPRKVRRTTWRKHCNLHDDLMVVSTLLRDEPTVIISGHYGNFELGGYLLGLFGFPTHTVARTIVNPHVGRFVNEFRGRTGQHMLPKQGSRDQVERVMQQGGALTLLGDQAVGPKGCWTPFFGAPASTHKAVSLFSLGYKAPTIVVGVRRTGGPLRYAIHAPAVVDPNEESFQYGTTPLLTAWFTGELEAIIREAPDQYWWVHNRWKGEPPKRRSKPTSGQAKVA